MKRTLRDYARDRLAGLNWLNVQGNSATKGAIFSFTLDGAAHAHDISTVLDKKGIAVRAGTHCAMPLMEHLGVGATCRASFGLYNTTAEVDALVVGAGALPRSFRLTVSADCDCTRPLRAIDAVSAPVAQLDRALPSEGKGHTFESCRVRQ